MAIKIHIVVEKGEYTSFKQEFIYTVDNEESTLYKDASSYKKGHIIEGFTLCTGWAIEDYDNSVDIKIVKVEKTKNLIKLTAKTILL